MFKKLISLKNFRWHVDYKFHNTDETFEAKLRKNFAPSPKTVIQLELYSKFFSTNWSSGNVQRNFNKPAEKMSPKNPRIYRSGTERGYFLESNVTPEMVLPARWIHFLEPFRKGVTENKNKLCQSPTSTEKCYTFGKAVFVEISPQTPKCSSA